MKTIISTPFGAMLLSAASMLAVHTSNAAVIYEDNFSGTAGTSINGRAPNVTDTTGSTYLASAGMVLNGGGQAVLSGGPPAVVKIALPTITSNDTITVSAVVRPYSTVDNFIAIGLTDRMDPGVGFPGSGISWALLKGTGSPTPGAVSVMSGLGTAGTMYASSSEPSYGGTGFSTFTMTYTVSTGNMKVDLSSANGSATLFNGLMWYNGAANTPAPVGSLVGVAFQFLNQNNSGTTDPGAVDSLTVSVVPEPAAIGLVLVGGTCLLLRRKFGRKTV